jgi:BON domain
MVGIVSQADVLSIFSPPDEEIRREMTDRVILQGLLMDPDRLQVTAQDGIVTLSGRPENDQVGTYMIEAAQHTEGVVAVWDQLGPADHHAHRHILMTRVSPRFRVSSEEHAGTVDLGADGDPGQSLSHQQYFGARDWEGD